MDIGSFELNSFVNHRMLYPDVLTGYCVPELVALAGYEAPVSFTELR